MLKLSYIMLIFGEYGRWANNMDAIQIFAHLKKDTKQLKLQMGTAARALTFLEGVFLALDFGVDF